MQWDRPRPAGVCAAEFAPMTTAKPVILVVEDEALVRMIAVAVAENCGFEVLEAATADEAINILETRSDIRLVFTDVSMPGSMDGLRLAHAIRGRWPPVELLVTSALGNITAKDLPERGRFLAKPYNVATLSRVFQQMTGD
jgi:CheY-like chemotaxis protein